MDELFGVTTLVDNKAADAERAMSEGGNSKSDHKTTETRMESV